MEPKPKGLKPQDIEPINPEQSETVLQDDVIFVDHTTGVGGRPGLSSKDLVTDDEFAQENPYSRT